MREMKAPPWETRPISRRCEKRDKYDRPCGKLSSHAYKAMGAGWMSLCPEHAEKHLTYCEHINALISQGETVI